MIPPNTQRLLSGSDVIVNGLAPGLNTKVAMVVIDCETVTSVTLETSNVATSLGTTSGVQLAAVFQSPLVGLRFQVALPARAKPARTKSSKTKGSALVFIFRPFYRRDGSEVKIIRR